MNKKILLSQQDTFVLLAKNFLKPTKRRNKKIWLNQQNYFSAQTPLKLFFWPYQIVLLVHISYIPTHKLFIFRITHKNSYLSKILITNTEMVNVPTTM